MVEVTCRLEDYSEPHKMRLKVNSHWLNANLVEIQVYDDRYVVDGYEIIEAVKNCMHLNKFN